MQALFSNPKARSKVCFRYAGAERMRTRWQALFSNTKARRKVRFGYAGAKRM
ncbi:MAG: hypothetical protein LBK66_12275 [Spirochaetaceae bacterium]|nr:hypothetical protein [Spirochaetaceae bacterium]